MTCHGEMNLWQDSWPIPEGDSGADRAGVSRPNEVAYSSLGPGTHNSIMARPAL